MRTPKYVVVKMAPTVDPFGLKAPDRFYIANQNSSFGESLKRSDELKETWITERQSLAEYYCQLNNSFIDGCKDGAAVYWKMIGRFFVDREQSGKLLEVVGHDIGLPHYVAVSPVGADWNYFIPAEKVLPWIEEHEAQARATAGKIRHALKKGIVQSLTRRRLALKKGKTSRSRVNVDWLADKYGADREALDYIAGACILAAGLAAVSEMFEDVEAALVQFFDSGQLHDQLMESLYKQFPAEEPAEFEAMGRLL